MKSYVIHPVLGRVIVNPRRDALRFIARWKNGEVNLTIPPGSSREKVMEVLDRLAPRLLDKKKDVAYYDGQVVECPGLRIHISSQSVKPDKVLGSAKLPEAFVEVGTALPFDSPDTTKVVSRMLEQVAAYVADGLLIPRAAALADELGLKVSKWSISRGHRVLGSCNSRREIKLSHVLVFMPLELRDYIVWHELAHLTEMSHNARFHALCDRYCHGQERRLIAALHAFRYPILRH